MEYRAVAGRCAVDLSSMPVPPLEALAIFTALGFEHVQVNLVELARSLVGVSQYRRGARLREAPDVFDCSSFTKYLYAKAGIWLPRRSIQQRAFGYIVEGDIKAGDLVFCSGRIDYFETDPSDGVGHVGLATGEGAVVHAANKLLGVVESSLPDFLGKPEDYRGIRRFIASDHVITIEPPPGREIETADDLKWVILQRMPRS